MVQSAEKTNDPIEWMGTASADEIAQFTAIADSWWDPDGDFRPLHQINPVRLTYIRDGIARHFGRDIRAEQPLKDLNIIDIGCGGGLLSEPLKRLGANVTGIDAGEKNIKVASVHAAQEGLDIDYRCVLPERLAAEGHQFDIVLNMEIIEHVADLNAFLGASGRMVKEGGVMILSTLNKTLKALALAKIGAEYILRWLPPGTHDWRKFVKPSELEKGLRPFGLKITDLKGLTYNPLSAEWLITDDLDVNYLAFAVKGG